MMRKRIYSILLALVLICSLVLPVLAAEKEESFTGTRQVCFTADWSDLENFVNGGRAAFDLTLRQSMPQWVDYSLRTQNHDVCLTLAYSFASFADYQEKTTALVMRKPSMVYSQEDGLTLIENCTSMDLLNFLESALNTQQCLTEKALDDIFSLASSAITVNSQEYELADGVSIRPDDGETIMMDALEIHTSTTKTYGYDREITALISLEFGSEADVSDLKSQFRQVGKVKTSDESEGYYEVSVSFQAVSQSELEYKTMLCLNGTTFIVEEQSCIDSSTVSVSRSEYFDLDSLLRPGATFTYSFSVPDYFENLTAADDTIEIDGSTVRAHNTRFVDFSYERGPQFSSVEILTDLSDPLGKIRRSIICTVPADVASGFHSNIIDKLELRMVRGTVLDIYDELGVRYYVLSFSSYFREQVDEFTASILDTSYALDIQSSRAPYGSWALNDCLNADNLVSRMEPAAQITATYVLPDLARLDMDPEEESNMIISGNTISFPIRSGHTVSILWRQINILSCALWILLVLTVLILVLWISAKIRRRRRTRARKIPKTPPVREKTSRKTRPVRQEAIPEQEISQHEVPSDSPFTPLTQLPPPSAARPPRQLPPAQYCPYCGEKTEPGTRFCGSCGSGLQ